MTDRTEVLVIGAGADGPALAWGLGEMGIDVTILEAGPWHGHTSWPDPHEASGERRGSRADELDGELLEEQFTGREFEMNSMHSGKLRWGPADRSRPPWFRVLDGSGLPVQVAGVGGTTLHYFANHPRAYPFAVNKQPDWPIPYEELLPYYRWLEEVHPIRPAPTTARDELFYQGCRSAGWDLLTGKNVTEPGYRPMPNAILPPDEALRGDYEGDFTYPEVTGSTLALSEFQGDALPRGAPLEEKARRSSNVSFVPRALRTGHVTIQPNSFVTRVLTDRDGTTATGVEYRHTWSGETRRIEAESVVMAAGCIETPRLWLKSDLPDNDWVGRGLTTHWFDFLAGVFEPGDLEDSIGIPHVNPHVGQNGSARLDYPGLGAVAVNTFPPGLMAGTLYGLSQSGYSFTGEVEERDPWDSRGKLAGTRLKEFMADYRRTLTLIIHTDDRPHIDNGVSLDSLQRDEHGSLPVIRWEPRAQDNAKRERLVEMGCDVLRAAGARHIHRADSPPIFLHMQSSMRMGKVTDEVCEARDVDRLFIADHSVLPNSLGGPNPTHTGQALALRTARALAHRYFSSRAEACDLLDDVIEAADGGD